MSKTTEYTFFIASEDKNYLNENKILGKKNTISVDFDPEAEKEMLSQKEFGAPLVIGVTVKGAGKKYFTILFVSEEKKQVYVREATSEEIQEYVID